MEKKVGEQLRILRESKNISLKTISQKSKIGLSLLQMLEADEYDKLPNKIYVVGFIKTYASILNIDAKPLIEAFESTFKIEEPIQNLKFAPVPGEAKKNPIPTLVMTSVVSGLLCFGGIFFIYKNSQKKLAELKKPIPVVKIVEKAPPKIEEPKPAPEVEKVPVKVEDPYTFKKDEKTLIEAHLPVNIQNSMVEGKQNLFLKAYKDATWITYKIDNEPIRKFILEKEKTLLLRGDEIRLFIGNVNATIMFINNRPLEVISKSGVKSLIFPETNKDKYKIPYFVFKEDGTVTTSEEVQKTN